MKKSTKQSSKKKTATTKGSKRSVAKKSVSIASLFGSAPDIEIEEKTENEIVKNIRDYKWALNNLKWLSEKSKIKLCYLAGINRPIAPSQVTTISSSVRLKGLLRAVVVAKIDFINGIPTYYIIDGQHLYNACIRNNMEIPYVICEIRDKEDLVETIAKLNSSSKSWKMTDYVTAWASLKEDYVKLNKYYQSGDLDISTLATILSNQAVDSSAMTNRVKKGQFKIVDEKKNAQIINNIHDVLDVLPRMNRSENKYLCREYVKFLRVEGGEYNHTKFITNLKKNQEKFVLATQEEGKLHEFFYKIK